ncbi:MAG TPA: PAS domain S-box protein [Thermodesulfobacteriota bacterium]|nr:PAS domain S-box protein [Thermodesulfobacteriota bacterium]
MRDKDKISKQVVEVVEVRQGVAESEMEGGLEQEKFRLIVELAPNAILMVNQKGEIVLVNSQTEKLFGYNREELIGRTVEILVPQRFQTKHSEYRKSFFVNPQARLIGTGRDLFAMRKDGGEFPVEIGLNPVKTEGGVLVLATIVDITERKRAEQLLRESEERLQAIMDNTTDAIMVYDEDGMVIAINREAERLFCSNNKTGLKNIWDVIPLENRADFSNILKSVKEGSRLLDYEIEKIIDNGERIPVSIGLVYMTDGSGMFIETIRDIRERIKLRNKIVELEKAQVIGKLAEGIAHHMGTPLASMLLRVQMLKEDIDEIPESKKFMERLDSIEKQIFYAQRVMQRLLKFASKPENVKRPENVSYLIEEAVDIIKPLLRKEGVELELFLDEDVKVWADSNLLLLVFSDIMMNAVDAMHSGGRLSITISNVNPDGQIQIKMSDTGVGISRSVLPLIFDPFFTTKPAGKGTGLGLSVAKRIIQDHNGEISIESTEGEGTSVLIRLPIYSEERTVA